MTFFKRGKYRFARDHDRAAFAVRSAVGRRGDGAAD